MTRTKLHITKRSRIARSSALGFRHNFRLRSSSGETSPTPGVGRNVNKLVIYEKLKNKSNY
jgi:hypothetical protein